MQKQGYFFSSTVNDRAYLYASSASRIYILFQSVREELLRKGSVMKKTKVLPWSAFVGHAYVQHGEHEWRGGYRVRRHTCLFSSSEDVPDATAFSHRESIYIWSKADVPSVGKVRNSLGADLDAQDLQN